jgi:hypothetical protein
LPTPNVIRVIGGDAGRLGILSVRAGPPHATFEPAVDPGQLVATAEVVDGDTEQDQTHGRRCAHLEKGGNVPPAPTHTSIEPGPDNW